MSFHFAARSSCWVSLISFSGWSGLPRIYWHVYLIRRPSWLDKFCCRYSSVFSTGHYWQISLRALSRVLHRLDKFRSGFNADRFRCRYFHVSRAVISLTDSAALAEGTGETILYYNLCSLFLSFFLTEGQLRNGILLWLYKIYLSSPPFTEGNERFAPWDSGLVDK